MFTYAYCCTENWIKWLRKRKKTRKRKNLAKKAPQQVFVSAENELLTMIHSPSEYAG
jgi:hypothetical protein